MTHAGASGLRQYVEEFGTVLAGLGLPPAYGKLLAWLLVCDPPAQSVSEIANGTGLSMGSASTGARMLERAGVIRRVAAPGRRGRFYEMAPDALARRAVDPHQYRQLRELLDHGLALLGDEPGPRTERLRMTRDFYLFLERELAKLVPRFLAEYRGTRGEGDG